MLEKFTTLNEAHYENELYNYITGSLKTEIPTKFGNDW